MSIKISKAKLTKINGLEVTYVDDDGNEIILKGCNPVHGDLKKSLRALVPYLADLTEHRESVMYDWDNPDSEANNDILKRLDVMGASIGGEDPFQVCTLIGRRTLLTSKVLNLCAPSTGFDPENEQYERCEDFRDTVYAFIYEAEQYILAKKWSVIQQEMKFENEDDPFGDIVDKTDGIPIEELEHQLEPVA